MNTSTDSTPGTVSRSPVAEGGGRRDDDRLWKILAAVAALALVGFIVYVVTRPHHPTPAAFPVTPPAMLPAGSTAPAFDLPRLGGGPAVSLASTRGTPTVVNFFASWCRDCQAELSAFGRFDHTAGGRVAIIGVDSNDSNSTAAQALLTKADATYPVGVDGNATVATSYRLTALPVTYFLDAEGHVVHVGFGSQSLATLEHWAGVLTGTGARLMSGEPEDGALVAAPPGASRNDTSPLTEAQRAAAFAAGRVPVDRAAALRAGSVPVPRKFILWVIAGFAVLGLGGIVAEHFIGNSGVESVITTPPATLAGTGPPPSTPTAPTGPAVGASPEAVIGLRHLTRTPAPGCRSKTRGVPVGPWPAPAVRRSWWRSSMRSATTSVRSWPRRSPRPTTSWGPIGVMSSSPWSTPTRSRPRCRSPPRCSPRPVWPAWATSPTSPDHCTS